MATMDPWDIEDIRSVPQGQMPTGTPTLEELFQQGNVQVSGGQRSTQDEAAEQLQMFQPRARTEVSNLPPSAEESRIGREGHARTMMHATTMGQWDPQYVPIFQKELESVGKEREAEATRQSEEQQIRMKGEEERKGLQMRGDFEMQKQRESQAAEQQMMLERLRKTPLSGLLGMTLEQFEALPEPQKEQYRRSVMMQSGGFGQFMQSMMTSVQGMPEGPNKENVMHYVLAQAMSIFTRQNIEELVTRTVDEKGNIRIRLKMLDPTGAGMGIKPGGQPYGPQEPWQARMARGITGGVSQEAAIGGTGAGVEGLVEDQFAIEDMFRR